MPDKIKKYRLVRKVNNMCTPAYVSYEIEKRIWFFGWRWITNDLFVTGRSTANTEEEGRRLLAIYNGEVPWIEKTII